MFWICFCVWLSLLTFSDGRGRLRVADWEPQEMAAITRMHLHHHGHAFPTIKPSLPLSKLSNSPSFRNFYATPPRKFSFTPSLCSISNQSLQVPYLILSLIISLLSLIWFPRKRGNSRTTGENFEPFGF